MTPRTFAWRGRIRPGALILLIATLCGSPAQARRRGGPALPAAPRAGAAPPEATAQGSSRRAADPKLTPQALRRLLRRFDHEPTVEAVQRAAVRRVLAGAGRPRQWLRRAGQAPWLPTLQLGVGLQQRRDRGLDHEAGLADRLRAAATNQIAYEIKMSWDLPRLIFDPNALRVIREAQRIAELREQVVLQVTRLYFERRRLQLAGWLRPVTTPSAILRRALRLAELTAVLNAMTGGLFRSEGPVAGSGRR